MARIVSLLVFPARAGMSRAAVEAAIVTSGFPRPRGDEPVINLSKQFSV